MPGRGLHYGCCEHCDPSADCTNDHEDACPEGCNDTGGSDE